MRSNRGTRSNRGLGTVELAATGATLLFVVVIAAAALVGHQQASDSREGAKSGHHMASLAQVEALLKKSQAEATR